MATTKLVVLSDIHAGSTVGLCPPDFQLVSGNIIKLNPQQQWLHDAWSWAIEQVHKRCPDGFDLILNGDLTEHSHHKSLEIISPANEDHQIAAVELLRPLSEAAGRTFVTLGTECHTGTGENVIARLLGAIEGPHSPAWPTLHLTFCGTRVFATHHMPTTKRPWLEANGLGMELASTMANYAREGFDPPRVYCYGHRHVFAAVHTASGVGIVNGAWQLLTRYGYKVVPGSLPGPSITVLDWSYGNEGDDPVVIPIRIKPPKPIYA